MSCYEETIKAATGCTDEEVRWIFDEMCGNSFDFSEAERHEIEQEARIMKEVMKMMRLYEQN